MCFSKKTFSIFWIFITLCAAVFSQTEESDSLIKFFNFEKPVYTIEQSLDLNIYPDSTNKFWGTDLSFACDMEELQGNAGFRVEKHKFDFTTSAVYAPLFWNCLNLGLTFTYHFYNYSERFFEHDILPGIYLKYQKTDFFSVIWTSCYLGKFSVIPSVKSAKPCLPTNTIAFYLDFAWNFDFCRLHFDIKTFDDYDYPIFFSPFLELGAEKHIYGPVSAGLNLKSEWIDVFTISSNPTTFTIECFIKAAF